MKTATKEDVLKRFMQEFFPYTQFKKMGFFTKEMKGDYKAQAERVCWFFGYETVFEYGANEIRCHITYDKKYHPNESFITVIPSAYE